MGIHKNAIILVTESKASVLHVPPCAINDSTESIQNKKQQPLQGVPRKPGTYRCDIEVFETLWVVFNERRLEDVYIELLEAHNKTLRHVDQAIDLVNEHMFFK